MTLNMKQFILSIPIVLFTIGAGFAADNQSGSVNAANGILAGQFMEKGKTPLANGGVFIYDQIKGPPSSDKYVRVPDYFADLDQEGKFTRELPAGTYYFIARKKTDIAVIGPPVEGQLIYFSMDSKGDILPFLVSAGKTTNSGVISSSVPRKRTQAAHEKGMTLIEGFVKDTAGAPVSGAIIYAYINPEILDKALYVSEKTGFDGKFKLHLINGGNYYLRVRGDYGGGIPKEGEKVNLDDPKGLIAVAINNGEKLTGVTIQVTRQKERGQLFKLKQ